MRKIILFHMITLDGFFAGPHGEIDWHRVDAEFNDFAIDQLHTADGLIFGRATYEVMASYWTTPAAIGDDPVVAGLMNAIQKYVFSTTLQKAEWSNTLLLKEASAGQIHLLKQQPGQDLFIFGSADLAATFLRLGLLDELRLMVNPVVLCAGVPLFKQPLNLSLLQSRPFQNGNVLLTYRPV